jgi:hypothetical protein
MFYRNFSFVIFNEKIINFFNIFGWVLVTTFNCKQCYSKIVLSLIYITDYDFIRRLIPKNYTNDKAMNTIHIIPSVDIFCFFLYSRSRLQLTRLYWIPSYSERVSPHRSLICSQIKYVYSEYPAKTNTFCRTDPFTINGIDCMYQNWNQVFFEKHFWRLR